ncbi:hypothetical protein F7734_57180 [Scytonema sp. UIC 10036]|uniref:hypothetical protein n=1 Tax=Scytonema sp. UIC 10036 TaxID=2304196 RepID=UPI0012DAF646|nr:hypothetical protein [Scytonema sp. UIC 10036]MUH01307.1 hypothetical protein [Scytonema sp. UIC 10036]
MALVRVVRSLLPYQSAKLLAILMVQRFVGHGFAILPCLLIKTSKTHLSLDGKFIYSLTVLRTLN